jgi:hypothetical protein
MQRAIGLYLQEPLEPGFVNWLRMDHRALYPPSRDSLYELVHKSAIMRAQRRRVEARYERNMFEFSCH